MRTSFSQFAGCFILMCGMGSMADSSSDSNPSSSWVAITQTQTVTRQPGNLFLNVVGPTGNDLPVLLPLSGNNLVAPVRVLKNASQIQVQTQLNTGLQNVDTVTVFSSFSLPQLSGNEIYLPDNHEKIIHSFIPDMITNSSVGIVKVGQDESGGYIETKMNSGIRRFPLDGVPVQAVYLGKIQQIAILVRSPSSGEFTLQICGIDQSQSILQRRALPDLENGPGYRPLSIATDAANNYVFVLTEGYVGNEASSFESLLYVFDIHQNKWLAGNRVLQGRAEQKDNPLIGGDDGKCYVLLRDPAREFGYVYCISAMGNESNKTWELSFSGVQYPMHASVGPERNQVTLGINKRVQSYMNGRLHGPAKECEAPVTALARSSSELAVGEGGRLHIIPDSEMSVERSIQFQLGHIIDILPIPVDGVLQSMNDVILPQFPPQVRLPNKRFGTHRITLWAGSGLESCTVLSMGKNLQDRLTHEYTKDESGEDWLTLEYRYPVDTMESPITSGALTIERSYPMSDGQMRRSHAMLYLDTSNSIRRDEIPGILWVNQGENEGSNTNLKQFSQVKRVLSQPPSSFAHTQLTDNEQIKWSKYDVVVVPITSAYLGILSRQSLLDYIANGGVIVWIGDMLPEDKHQDFARWLEPLGMHMLPYEKDFLTLSSDRLKVGMKIPSSRKVPKGSLVRTSTDHTVLVSAPDTPELGLIAYRDFGLGRFVYLSSPVWLSADMVSDAEGVRFIRHFFDWLVSTGRNAVDTDGDGLSDTAEDMNGNGQVDSDETDFYKYDTDNDGLGDGLEDINMNGRTEAGETNPLQYDTNRNGIWDGVDVRPMLSMSAPYIQGINPASAPAEGGADIVIEGRNLGSGIPVYFGARPSPEVTVLDSNTLIAKVPAGTDELIDLPQDVHIGDPAYDVEGILENAFTYTVPTGIEVSLTSLAYSVEQYGMYSGQMAMHLRPGSARIGRVELVLQAEPPEAVTSIEIKPSKRIGQAGRALRVFKQAPSLYRIELDSGLPMNLDLPLLTFNWTADCTTRETRSLIWRVVHSDVREQFGGSYGSSSKPLVYQVGSSQPRI